MMPKTKVQMLRRSRIPIEGLFCNYAHRICMQNRLDGYDFCIKHILEDKNSLYKQCTYMSNKTNKRCTNAAPKSERKDGHCSEHQKKVAISRLKGLRKRRPRETAESLLEQLDRYSKPETLDNNSELNKKLRSDHVASRILDYASSSDSEGDNLLVDQAWRGDADSDAESIDSEQEDPLKHAGVYSAEEAALIMQNKLIRLQSLYIDQFKRLQYVMKEKRRRYLVASKQEREMLGSIHAYKDHPQEAVKYRKFTAMKRYHKRYGKEALLHRQSKQRRVAVSQGVNHRPPSYPKCTHVEDGVRCVARVIPLSKFCPEHILHDPHQVLYQPCSFADGRCGNPVTMQRPGCPRHVQLNEMEWRVPINQEENKDDVSMQVDIKDVKVTMEIPMATTNSLYETAEMKSIDLNVPQVCPTEIFTTQSSDSDNKQNNTKVAESSVVSKTDLGTNSAFKSNAPTRQITYSQLLLQHLKGDYSSVIKSEKDPDLKPDTGTSRV